MATRARTAEDRNPAQWFCLVVGAVLVLAGLFGFLADSAFDTGSGSDSLNGDTLLGLEVNGWHNLVHLASGLFLLAMARRRDAARTAAFAFAAIYAVVTVIGMIDGHDVLGLLPVNPADNVLHLLLALAGLGAGLAPDRRDTRRDDGGVVRETPAASDRTRSRV
jgi:hypothetical protein